MEKKIEVCIGTDRSKGLRIRLSLLFVENGETIHEQYHSAMLMPGDNFDEVRKNIESHIGMVGGGVPGAPWPKIPDSEWEKVTTIATIVHK